jgi:hypothetical protein
MQGIGGRGKYLGILADTVYRRKSGTEDYREEVIAALYRKPARTPGEAGAVIEGVSGLKRSPPRVMKFLKKRLPGAEGWFSAGEGGGGGTCE